MDAIDKLIIEVVQAAKAVQTENGPDPDYRRYAQQHLDRAIAKLKREIEKKPFTLNKLPGDK